MSKESAIFKNATRVHVTEKNGRLTITNRRDIVSRSIREVEEYLQQKEMMRLMIEEQQKTLELIERGKIKIRKIEQEVGYVKPKYKPFKKVIPQELKHDKNDYNTKPASTDSRSESRHKANQLSKNKFKK